MVQQGSAPKKTVAVVDDDRDISELIQTVLLDEGFKVACLFMQEEGELKAAIDQVGPDCVVLDGTGRADYDFSWGIAGWLASRPRPIPTIMFTGHTDTMDEAILHTSARAEEARFVGLLPKPFDIDRLIESVHRAVGRPPPPTDRQEADRQASLLESLRAAGAAELATSHTGRVWATFRAGPEGRLYKVYRWRMADAYFVGRYVEDGSQLEPLAQFTSFDALIAFCMTQIKGGGAA